MQEIRHTSVCVACSAGHESDTVKTALQSAGLETLYVSRSGEACLADCARAKPDIIVLGLKLGRR